MTASNNRDAAELHKFDQLAHRFWDPAGDFKPLHVLNPVRASYIAEKRAVRDTALLDVGCGGGLLAEALAARGARVKAIDLAPGMIEIAKLHALESGASVDYHCQSAESLLPLESAHYGIVSCMEMLEHVPEPAAMLNTLGALTAPGGAVFVSTINRHWRAFVGAIVGAEYLLRLLPRGTHEFARFIKPSELARWGRDAGLVLEDIRGLDYHPVTEIAQLSDDPRVNYIACFAKPA